MKKKLKEYGIKAIVSRVRCVCERNIDKMDMTCNKFGIPEFLYSTIYNRRGSYGKCGERAGRCG